MSINVVSKFDFFLKKKKILKLWPSKVKNSLSKMKKFVIYRSEDFFMSEQSYKLAFTPVPKLLFSILTSLEFRRLLVGIINSVIMIRLENRDLGFNFRSSEKLFIFSSKRLKCEYILGFFLKIFILDSTYNTARSLPNYIEITVSNINSSNIETTVSNINSSDKVITIFKVTSSTRVKMLNLCYFILMELKAIDLLHYILVLMHGRRVLQACFISKTLREIDFMVLVIIIVIQISFTILDSINLNSSKK
jgi:hypothetical protein